MKFYKLERDINLKIEISMKLNQPWSTIVNIVLFLFAMYLIGYLFNHVHAFIGILVGFIVLGIIFNKFKHYLK